MGWEVVRSGERAVFDNRVSFFGYLNEQQTFSVNWNEVQSLSRKKSKCGAVFTRNFTKRSSLGLCVCGCVCVSVCVRVAVLGVQIAISM